MAYSRADLSDARKVVHACSAILALIELRSIRLAEHLHAFLGKHRAATKGDGALAFNANGVLGLPDLVQYFRTNVLQAPGRLASSAIGNHLRGGGKQKQNQIAGRWVVGCARAGMGWGACSMMNVETGSRVCVRTSAASLPARTAPSIEPRNFCDVQSPARVNPLIGVSWEGLYLLRPGIAA
eukprot:scaffold228591_cov32-Tisochrysis_lutea.AAC.5